MSTPATAAAPATTPPLVPAVESPPARPAPTQEEFNAIFRRMKDAEEALAGAKKKLDDHEAKGLSDVERLTRQVAELQTQADQAKQLAESFSQLLVAEIQTVPEKFRGLVPAGLSDAQKVLWIRNARAAGMFGPEAAVAAGAPATDDGKPGTTPKGKWTNSKIGALTKAEFLKYEAEINAALAAGEVTPD